MKANPSRILATLAVLAVASMARAEGAPQLKAGFRDMTLGEPISKLKGADCGPSQKIGESSTRSCKRPSDRLKIGDVKLTEVSYQFLGGKLWFVSFSARDDNCQPRIRWLPHEPVRVQ